MTARYGAGAGGRAMGRLLALPDPPTAVFAYSDELALAAMAHARSTGLRVPEDLSVVGVDGHPLGEQVGVTTVDQDDATQGRIAAELVVQLVSGTPVSDVDVPLRLVHRRSSGAAPA